jgi:hypothetical protein
MSLRAKLECRQDWLSALAYQVLRAGLTLRENGSHQDDGESQQKPILNSTSRCQSEIRFPDIKGIIETLDLIRSVFRRQLSKGGIHLLGNILSCSCLEQARYIIIQEAVVG